MAMAVVALGVVAIAFIPDLFQEVARIMLILPIGLIMFLFAVILAVKTKRYLRAPAEGMSADDSMRQLRHTG